MLENLTAVCPLGIKIRMDWLAKRFWLATLRELLICVLMMVDIPKPSCCLSVEERSYSKKLSRNTYLSKRTAFQWWVNADFVLFFWLVKPHHEQMSPQSIADIFSGDPELERHCPKLWFGQLEGGSRCSAHLRSPRRFRLPVWWVVLFQQIILVGTCLSFIVPFVLFTLWIISPTSCLWPFFFCHFHLQISLEAGWRMKRRRSAACKLACVTSALGTLRG